MELQPTIVCVKIKNYIFNQPRDELVANTVLQLSIVPAPN